MSFVIILEFLTLSEVVLLLLLTVFADCIPVSQSAFFTSEWHSVCFLCVHEKGRD